MAWKRGPERAGNFEFVPHRARTGQLPELSIGPGKLGSSHLHPRRLCCARRAPSSRKHCPAGPPGTKSSWPLRPSPALPVKVQRYSLHGIERRGSGKLNSACIMGGGRGQDWKKSSLEADKSHLSLQRKLWEFPFVLFVHFIPHSSGLNFIRSST